MIKFLLSLVASLLLAFGYYLLVFGTAYEIRNVSDALFVVGLLLFFLSLIAITDAARVFMSFAYTFKNLFKSHREKYTNFYDYSQAKKDNTSSFGLSTLFISIVFIVAAALIASNYLANIN